MSVTFALKPIGKIRRNMMGFCGLSLFLLTVTAIVPVDSASEKATTCTTGQFKEGDTAVLTCNFADNIDNHDSVYIQYYPISAATDASERTVLACSVDDVKASRCKGQANNCMLKEYTNTSVVIEIRSVSRDAAGLYMCQFLPHDDSLQKKCLLNVEGKPLQPLPEKIQHHILAVSILSLLGIVVVIIDIFIRQLNKLLKRTGSPMPDYDKDLQESLIRILSVLAQDGKIDCDLLLSGLSNTKLRAEREPKRDEETNSFGTDGSSASNASRPSESSSKHLSRAQNGHCEQLEPEANTMLLKPVLN